MLSKHKGLVKIDGEDSSIYPQKNKLHTVIYNLHSVMIVQIHFVFDVKEK